MGKAREINEGEEAKRGEGRMGQGEWEKGCGDRVMRKTGRDQGLLITDSGLHQAITEQWQGLDIHRERDPQWTPGISRGLLGGPARSGGQQTSRSPGRNMRAPPGNRHVPICSLSRQATLTPHGPVQRHPASPTAQQESGRCLGSASDPKCFRGYKWGKEQKGR